MGGLQSLDCSALSLRTEAIYYYEVTTTIWDLQKEIQYTVNIGVSFDIKLGMLSDNQLGRRD